MVHYLRHRQFMTLYSVFFFKIKKKYPLPYNTVYNKCKKACTCIFQNKKNKKCQVPVI